MEAVAIVLIVIFLFGLKTFPHILTSIQEWQNKELLGYDIDWQYIELEERKQKELEGK